MRKRSRECPVAIIDVARAIVWRRQPDADPSDNENWTCNYTAGECGIEMVAWKIGLDMDEVCWLIRIPI